MRYYGPNYRDLVVGQLNELADLLSVNTYTSAINNVTITYAYIESYRSEAQGIAALASADIGDIISNASTVATMLSEFYDDVELTGGRVYTLAHCVTQIGQTVSTALSNLNAVMSGTGKYSGQKVNPDSLSDACSGLSDAAEPAVTYYETLFIDNDGNLDEDELDRYCNKVDRCDNPSTDFYSLCATQGLVNVVDEKLADCESIEEYEAFVNMLLRHFYVQNDDDDLPRQWENTAGSEYVFLANGDYPEAVFFTYNLRDSGNFFLDTFQAEFPCSAVSNDDFVRENRFFIDFYTTSQAIQEIPQVVIPVYVDSDEYQSYRNDYYSDASDDVDQIPTWNDANDVDYPFPGFSITEADVQIGDDTVSCTRIGPISSLYPTIFIYDKDRDVDAYVITDEVGSIDVVSYDTNFDDHINVICDEDTVEFIDSLKMPTDINWLEYADTVAGQIVDSAIGYIPVYGTIYSIGSDVITAISDVGYAVHYEDMAEAYNIPYDNVIDEIDTLNEQANYASNCGGSSGSFFIINSSSSTQPGSESNVYVTGVYVNVNQAQSNLGFYSRDQQTLVEYGSDEADDALHSSTFEDNGSEHDTYQQHFSYFYSDFARAHPELNLPRNEYDMDSEDYKALIAAYNRYYQETGSYYNSGDELPEVDGFNYDNYRT